MGSYSSRSEATACVVSGQCGIQSNWCLHECGKEEKDLRRLRQIWYFEHWISGDETSANFAQLDVIIVEDDPYFFLQYPDMDIETAAPKYEKLSNDEFLSSLVPSFLRFDYQGRVIRLESFSKTLAPGLRLGYFVANPLFTERLLRATEVETQDPSGISQALVLSLLTSWTTSGYITWLQNLRLEYQKRRDWMLAAIRKNFSLVPASDFPELHAEGLVAAIDEDGGSSQGIPIFSFIPPTGGMFIWTKFYFGQNSAYLAIKDGQKESDHEQAFANRLWAELAEERVLLTPGYYYHPWQGAEKTSTAARAADADTSHFRLTFAMTTVSTDFYSRYC